MRLVYVVLPILVLGVSGIYAGIQGRNALSDDAFILLRVLRHALEGEGLRFNPGETGVQPCTSPLNLLLTFFLAKTLSLFGMPIESACLNSAAILFMVSMPLFAIGMLLLTEEDSKRVPFALMGGLIAISSPIVHFTAGIETVPLMALLIWSALAFALNKFTLSAWLSAFAVLMRHDAILFWMLVVVYIFFYSPVSERKTLLFRFVVPLVLVLGPWLVFSGFYYGTTIPTTLVSKMAQGGTIYWSAPYYLRAPKWIVEVFFGQIWLAIVLFILACIGLTLLIKRAILFSRITRKDKEEHTSKSRAIALMILTLFAILHFAFYSFLGIPDYHWYFVPYAMVMLLLSVKGAEFLFPFALEPRFVAAISVLFGVLAIVFLRAPAKDFRLDAYREAAQYIRMHPPKNALGTMEIGMVGFFAPEVKIFDFSGVATLSQVENIARNDATAWLKNPDVADKVLIRGEKHPLDPDSDSRFESLYEKEMKFRGNDAFPSGLEIWRLKTVLQRN
ncbi:MAG TPA: hypothetical protein VNK96_01815 [Fimbriimonadales bacterium]|nr:hypothetical protein [Fimbriimonadales bacterium]